MQCGQYFVVIEKSCIKIKINVTCTSFSEQCAIKLKRTRAYGTQNRRYPKPDTSKTCSRRHGYGLPNKHRTDHYSVASTSTALQVLHVHCLFVIRHYSSNQCQRALNIEHYDFVIITKISAESFRTKVAWMWISRMKKN